MTETPATVLVVVKMPAENYFDYENPTGPRAVAVALAEAHGGIRTGGGTDLTTGMSDLDFAVPTDRVGALCAALREVGLPFRAVVAQEGV